MVPHAEVVREKKLVEDQYIKHCSSVLARRIRCMLKHFGKAVAKPCRPRWLSTTGEGEAEPSDKDDGEEGEEEEQEEQAMLEDEVEEEQEENEESEGEMDEAINKKPAAAPHRHDGSASGSEWLVGYDQDRATTTAVVIVL